MGRVKGCESCGSQDWKHAADIYDVPDVLMCWECETGALFEQARIIKLLEEKCQCGMVMHKGYMVKRICPAHTHIALIKGEK